MNGERRGAVKENGGEGGNSITFDTLADGSGLQVVDSIERHRYELRTPRPVSPSPVETSQFLFPVDASVRVTTEAIGLPTVVAVYIRDAAGEMLTEVDHFAHEELPDGEYSLELCAPLKLYLHVRGSVTVSADAFQTSIQFGEETDVAVGARSHHKHPAATVTTTSDPTDMMKAISTFGSALKTTSPERSYPTLRGHPPTIEQGDALDIPPGVEAPDTGVTLELPADYRSIFVAAPLAYYLGATVVPGSEPRLVTETGFEYAFPTGRGFEAEVERVLKQVFFLDCVTRTEGYYRVDLHERRAIEPHVDLDFAALYEQSLPEQLEAYLDVPFGALEPHMPEWKQTTHVAPNPTSVELLPFVVDDLAVVRTPQVNTVPSSEIQAASVDEFFRDKEGEEAFTRSASSDPSGPTAVASSFVQPESTDSLEQTWVGDGTPVGASKATTEAFNHRLDRTPTEGDIDITVVCNDAQMDEEREAVDESYGSRSELPFDVTLEHDLTTAELRAILESPSDFLHYIGHIDDDGFQCSDGKLDVSTLDTVGVDAFLLNACQSYSQGMELLSAGAIGGIVTLSDVLNSGAVRIGSAMARLLNRGFPLQAALDIAKGESIVGGQYIVVGDGGLAIAQAESGTPNLCEIESDNGTFELTIRTYPTSERGLGSMVVPNILGNERYFLSSGHIQSYQMSKQELANYFELEEIPVIINGKLRWSDDISVGSL